MTTAPMAPNIHADPQAFLPYPGPFLILRPLQNVQTIEIDAGRVLVPLEHNLRALLVTVTGTEDLQRVTVVKLRVIARDVPLQHLSLHAPFLRELILDGSVVSSLRDLGCSLRNLKILRANRCGMRCIDAMAGWDGLEELHATDNCVESVSSCAFFPNLVVLDLARNKLKNVCGSLGLLRLCDKLEHIHLEGNDEICQLIKYRQTVKSLLPALRSLDGVMYASGGDGQDERVSAEESNVPRPLSHDGQSSSATAAHSPRLRNATNGMEEGFTIRFPPKVFLNTLNN